MYVVAHEDQCNGRFDLLFLGTFVLAFEEQAKAEEFAATLEDTPGDFTWFVFEYDQEQMGEAVIAT